MDQRAEPPTAEQLAADDTADGARPAASARRPVKRAAPKKSAPKKAAPRKRTPAGDDTQQLTPIRTVRSPAQSSALSKDPRVVHNAAGRPVVYVSDETDPYLEQSLRALREPTMATARVPVGERPHWSPRGQSASKRMGDAKRIMWLKLAAFVAWQLITAAVLVVAERDVGLAGLVIVVYSGLPILLVALWLIVGDVAHVVSLRSKVAEEEERARAVDAR